MKKIIEEHFSLFTRAKLHTFVAIYKRLKKLEIDPDDFIAGVQEIEGENAEKIQKSEKKFLQESSEVVQLKCPECNDVLVGKPINIPKGRGNLYGYKIHIFCPSCLYERFE